MSTPAPPTAGTVTVFMTSWCPFCRMLRTALERQGVDFTEVDVDRRPDAAEFVMLANGGNRTVPTVLFPDGSTLTNPSGAEVAERLA
ncbi:mycoredoxin [Phycicoccus sp. CSK15P-2]|uniref:mycoredoxin n=1 Tax=Phycicoccus sp. CSK15P-2 TaxID=2807627 RepID=UPI00194F0DA5|nr:mycoredoxin [Phycicoccus sp. CSK15P-2]MBM6405209.1 mycoredoxin [Phycicoccus sp. CSK15P-2]